VLDRETGEHVPVRLRADAVEFFREILHRHAPQDAVAGESDHAWLTWLLEGSPAAQQFHGPPPYAFVIHSNKELGYAGQGQGFSVMRFSPRDGVLGTTIDTFSITRVLANNVKEEEDLIVRAFRNAIEDQLVLFRANKLSQGVVCPFQRVVLDAGNAYVVHTPSFKEWVQKFLLQSGVSRTQLRFEPSVMLQLSHAEGAPAGFNLVERWREFHRAHALPLCEVVSFKGFYAALRRDKQRERDVQDINLMAMRTGR
jgi:hypothetical protein